MPRALSPLQPTNKTKLKVPSKWLYLKTKQSCYFCGSLDSTPNLMMGISVLWFRWLRDHSGVLELEGIVEIIQTSGFQNWLCFRITGGTFKKFIRLNSGQIWRSWVLRRGSGNLPWWFSFGDQWSGLTFLLNKGLKRWDCVSWKTWDCVSWKNLDLMELNDLSKGWLGTELGQQLICPWFQFPFHTTIHSYGQHH